VKSADACIHVPANGIHVIGASSNKKLGDLGVILFFLGDRYFLASRARRSAKAAP
jgi:hypothetical protein